MSATATAEFFCEVCSTPLRYHGGPNLPRWCGKHRGQMEAARRRDRNRNYREQVKSCGKRCEACEAPLLTPDVYCGFCLVEMGIKEAA